MKPYLRSMLHSALKYRAHSEGNSLSYRTEKQSAKSSTVKSKSINAQIMGGCCLFCVQMSFELISTVAVSKQP